MFYLFVSGSRGWITVAVRYSTDLNQKAPIKAGLTDQTHVSVQASDVIRRERQSMPSPEAGQPYFAPLAM